MLITAAVALMAAAPGGVAASGWASPRFVLPLVLGAALLAGFAAVDGRVSMPLVRLGYFRLATVRAANLVTPAAGAMTGAGHPLLTMYLRDVLGYSPVRAGPAVAPTGIVNLGLGPIAGRLVTRIGVRAAMTGATLAAACRAGLALAMSPGQSYPVPAAAIPMGMAFLLTTVRATAGVGDTEQGPAGGLRQTALQLGIA